MKTKLVPSLGLFLSACASMQPTSQIPLKMPEVHGHRGARWVRPENTLPAFQYALDEGVAVLEMDLGVTKDNVLVVYHDQTLNPVFCRYKNGKEITGEIPIHKLTLKQVKELDCGSKKNPKFPEQVLVPGTEIPTFDEFATMVAAHPRGKTVRFNIETKSEEAHPTWQPGPKKFASLVVGAFKKHKILDRTILQSFDFRTLVEARKIEPKIVISALVEYKPQGSLTEIAKTLNANITSSDHEWLTKEEVGALHAMNVQVAPWTANTEADWKKLIDFGVDAIITDNPKGLMDYLKSLTKNRVQGSRAVEAVKGTGGVSSGHY